MKNTIKMSLAAAVAVSALSTTASAKAFEEAIKDVDVSGSVVYRYDDRTNDVSTVNTTSNSYKAVVNLKSKVNDMVTFNGKVSAANGTMLGGLNNGLVGLNTATSGDANPAFELENASFTIQSGATTAIVGKQGLATPFTVANDSDSNTQTGTGVVAMYNAGVATLAAAYFNQTNLGTSSGIGNGTQDVAALAVIAPVGPVNIDVWYADVDTVFDAYTIGVNGNFDIISADLRYTSLDLDAATTDNDLVELRVAADLAPFGVAATFGKTDKQGGLVALDSDATTGLQAWNINVNNKADAKYWRLDADMDINEQLNASLTYAEVEYEEGTNATIEDNEEEIFAQLTYNMSANLSTYLRYGVYEQDIDGVETIDRQRGRLQVQYSF